MDLWARYGSPWRRDVGGSVAADDVAIGGIILIIDADGSLRIDRGYVRREDEPVPEPITLPKNGAKGVTSEGVTEATVMPFYLAPEPGGQSPRPFAALLVGLEAHRTAGSQAALAWLPELLALMVHAWATVRRPSPYIPRCPRRCLPGHCHD